MTLVKATLMSQEAPSIKFMFNPTNLSFKQNSNVNKNDGARTEKGLPKVTFAHPSPRTLTIGDIIFDTYEKGTSVMGYIALFETALKFIEAKKRPPLYVFNWGVDYIRCFVVNVDWNLTMFDSNGIPVRAKVSITLEEIDEQQIQPPQTTPAGDRNADSREIRQSGS